jgi:hypothetical protein
VIDKLELCVGPEVPFTSAFECIYRQIGRKGVSKYYKERTDLRQHGLNAILHKWCRFNATHKLAFLGTAHMGFRQMASQIESVFDCDSAGLRVVRIDCAVDVPGISLGWFRTHCRVPSKRSRFEISGDGELGATIYFGRGPDLVRIYDKIAERERRTNSGKCGQQTVSIPLSGRLVLTRVERQIRSGRIPTEFKTFGSLCANAMTVDPFSRVLIVSGGKPELCINDHPIRDYLEGLGLRHLILEIGLAGTWAALGARSGGNVGRIFRRLKSFIPTDPEDFEMPNLFDLYRKSLHRQLSADSLQPKFPDRSTNLGRR